MGISGNNRFLHFQGQIHPLGAVAGHPDQEVFVVFRVFLGVPQNLVAHHIELYMEGAQGEIALQQGAQVGLPPRVRDQVMAQAQV